MRFGLPSDGGAPLHTEITPVDRQFTQICDEGSYERRLHISVDRSLVGKRLNEVQDRFVSGIDSHDARPSQRFDIWAQLGHTPGKLGLLARLGLEPGIDMNRLGHLVLSNDHQSSAEVVAQGRATDPRQGTSRMLAHAGDAPPVSDPDIHFHVYG